MTGIEIMEKKMKTFDKKGQFEYTNHENMFANIYPLLERQVTFGTGTGGLSQWGSKKFTADFYDPLEKIVIEIDGESHKNFRVQIKDELRKRFFESKGIKVIRLTNSQVERLFSAETERGVDIFEQTFSRVL